ncbi:MAG: sensor domain-containing diguanylate cyclase [Sulfuricurvum sp.]|uniref:sensor domain-containing diguanylate cyclase n=1 Tax=Sulfuricurvum sp. TaxID=2025608 RepID=UPI002719C5F2|nr:sensor domain-containing diguanylate cyclase [Sulfuricurvum sp.]MDO9055808.1 sensor domain-containing diguanylate cyclase [Sulfuricurvum sp.]MDP3292584.1 sensor domain-containing diguanylate cyclase [Sulfuricurvum sp.]
MSKRLKPTDTAQLLRRRAETIAKKNGTDTLQNLEKLTSTEIKNIVYELNLHQIELELQNEELQRVQIELEDERKRYFDLYELAPIGYCTLDAHGVIVQTNRTAALLLTLEQRDLLQHPFSTFVIAEDQDIYYLYSKQLLQCGSNPICELRMLKADQTLFWANLTTTIVRDLNNTPQWRVVISDISERKKYENKLQEIAQYDPLTALPNRILLADRLHQAMAQTNRHKQPFAVLYLDLDGFKNVNDTYGHEAGDQLLIKLATNMKRTLREIDTIARIGGDEFVILLLNLNDIQACVPMLNRLLESVQKPVLINNHSVEVSASFGITFFPQSIEIDADQLLAQADYAMYQAKSAGKNRYYVFVAEENEGYRSI